MYRHDELLFHRGSVHQVLEFQRGALQRHIDGLTSIIVLKEPSADLERELLARFTINIPKILEGDIFVSPPREVEIQRQDYGRTLTRRSMKWTSLCRLRATGRRSSFNPPLLV